MTDFELWIGLRFVQEVCPISAKQAAAAKSTYPEPTTAIRIVSLIEVLLVSSSDDCGLVKEPISTLRVSVQIQGGSSTESVMRKLGEHGHHV